MNFQNKLVHIWTYAPDDYRMVIYKPRLAKKINAILGSYDKDTKFLPGEELLFRFSRAQIKTIAQGNRYLSKILAQITEGIL